MTQAARQLFGNIPANTPEPTAWPLRHPAEYTLIWTVPILVITIPVANAQYRVSTSR